MSHLYSLRMPAYIRNDTGAANYFMSDMPNCGQK